MTLRMPAKVLLHVWSYDFYDMTLSTGKQRRHMINLINIHWLSLDFDWSRGDHVEGSIRSCHMTILPSDVIST